MSVSRIIFSLALLTAFSLGACGGDESLITQIGGGSGNNGGGSSGGGGEESASNDFLVDLHLHGSMSEGAATMHSHTVQAEAAGFDGLWWTDHMGRQLASSHQHGLDFEGDMNGDVSYGNVISHRSMKIGSGDLSSFDSSFDTLHATEGSEALHIRFSSEPGSPWQKGGLIYRAQNDGESITLVADPHITFDFRMDDFSGDVGVAVRVTLSSTFSNGLKEGQPRVLQFVPQGFSVPPDQDVMNVELNASEMESWVHFDCDVRNAAARFWPPVDDLSLKKVEFLLASRDGGEISFSFDTFRIDLRGALGSEVFQRQYQTLSLYNSDQLFHHVGSEMGGPFEQEITSISTRDHIISLFPHELDEVLEFPEGSLVALDYPQSGVDWIHVRGGVAILAHVFGAGRDEDISESTVEALTQRLLDENAFEADGLEVGYYQRGRPLQAFVDVWDTLTRKGILLTGVGSSDNHNLEVWSERVNRMATWLTASDSSASNLCSAVRSGHAYFGDPHMFDPKGSLSFEELEGAYTMGDVVPLPQGIQELSLKVDGARQGDVLVLLRNGVEENRWQFESRSLEVVGMIIPQAGDWLRLEVRDSLDGAYLFSNPIYFIAADAQPPEHRKSR